MYCCSVLLPIYLTMTLFHHVASSMNRNAGRNLAASAFIPTQYSHTTCLHRFSTNLATVVSSSSQPSFLLQQAQQQAAAASVLLYSAARRSQATNNGGSSSLTRTEIRRMRVSDLREELGRRGLSSSGLREALVARLLDASSSPVRSVASDVSRQHPSPATISKQRKRNMSASAAPVAFDNVTNRIPDETENPNATCSGSIEQPLDVSAATATQLSPEKTYVLRFDGGSRGNPGVAGAGMVLYDADEGTEVWSGYHYMGDRYTNNEAEYQGIIEGLRCVYSMGARSVVVQGDSMLVIKQLEGKWRVKAENLRPYYQNAMKLLKQFDSFHVNHIDRAENSRADELANEAMDLRGSRLDL
jgi:ribonuclease HI